jgi:hypothetical protein
MLPNAHALHTPEGENSAMVSHIHTQCRLGAMLAYQPNRQSIRIGGRPATAAVFGDTSCPTSKHGTLADQQQQRITIVLIYCQDLPAQLIPK